MRVGCSMHHTYKREPGIYIFTNKVNGKKYVGESMNIRERMCHYFNANLKALRPFESALRKYGHINFDFKIMYFPKISKDELLTLEETFIFLESSLTREHGYNICSRGINRLGTKHSAASLELISKSSTGRFKTVEVKSKISDTKRNNCYNMKQTVQMDLFGNHIKTYKSAHFLRVSPRQGLGHHSSTEYRTPYFR